MTMMNECIKLSLPRHVKDNWTFILFLKNAYAPPSWAHAKQFEITSYHSFQALPIYLHQISHASLWYLWYIELPFSFQLSRIFKCVQIWGRISKRMENALSLSKQYTFPWSDASFRSIYTALNFSQSPSLDGRKRLVGAEKGISWIF